MHAYILYMHAKFHVDGCIESKVMCYCVNYGQNTISQLPIMLISCLTYHDVSRYNFFAWISMLPKIGIHIDIVLNHTCKKYQLNRKVHRRVMSVQSFPFLSLILSDVV